MADSVNEVTLTVADRRDARTLELQPVEPGLWRATVDGQ